MKIQPRSNIKSNFHYPRGIAVLRRSVQRVEEHISAVYRLGNMEMTQRRRAAGNSDGFDWPTSRTQDLQRKTKETSGSYFCCFYKYSAYRLCRSG